MNDNAKPLLNEIFDKPLNVDGLHVDLVRPAPTREPKPAKSAPPPKKAKSERK